MSRQTVIAPIGLITQPNEYGQYKRGALKIAKNVAMRSPGLISSMPALTTVDGTYGDSSANRQVIGPMLAGDTLVLKETGITGVGTATNLAWTSFTSAFTNITPPSGYGVGADFVSGGSRSALERFRNRYFAAGYAPRASFPTAYNGGLGVRVIDSEGGATARFARIAPPIDIDMVTYPGSVMADNTACAYRVLFRRIHSDGYETVSAPSARKVIGNISGSEKTTVVYPVFSEYDELAAGDLCEVYRTATVIGNTTDPGDVCYLAMSQVVTSTDIANGYMAVIDACPDGGLGVELYTNPGQEGAEAPNFGPPMASDLAMFKGHMFYTAPEVPAQAVIGPQNAYGNLSTDFERTYGIGKRTVTATFSNGSPILTAVSNMRGVVVGQMVYSSRLNGGNGSRVTAIGATTITCSHNSVGSATESTYSFDQLRLACLGFTAEAAAESFLGLRSLVFFIPGSVQTGNYDRFLEGGSGYPGSWAAGAAYHGASMTFVYNNVWSGGFTLRVTNGVNYAPPLPEYGATANTYSPQVKKNRYVWSKFQQPEHCPPLNYAFCGVGEIYRLVPTRDAMWMFCSDGLHRLSGNGGDGSFAWQEDMADPNLVLAGRNAVCTLKETVWCYTNRGLVAISDDGGIQELSLGVLGELPGAAFVEDSGTGTFMAADEAHAEVWLFFQTGTFGSGSTTAYVFNTLTKTFVSFNDTKEYTSATYSKAKRSILLGDVIAGLSRGSFVYYFNDDASTSRLAGAQISYQPLHGSDPMDMKQFQDVTYLWQGMNAAGTVTPTFDVRGAGAVASTALAVNQGVGDSFNVVGVPRRAAIQPNLRPGWQMGIVAAPWSFKGVSVRFAPGGDNVVRD